MRRSTQSARSTARADAVRDRSSRQSDSRKPQVSNREVPVSRGIPRIPLVAALAVWVVSIVVSVIVTRAVISGTNGQSAVVAGAENAQTASSVSETSGTQKSQTLSDTTSGSETGTDDADASDTTLSGESSSSTKSSKSQTKTAGGVESPWTDSGTFTTGDASLDEDVKKFCDERATTDMDIDTALTEVYTGVAWSEYVERDDAQHPSGKDWRIEYAHKYYDHDCSGNCYEFAAFLSYCLQYMGLEDAHAEGILLELQSGGWGDHGIVFVTNTEGEACLCDTSLGLKGWMLPETSYNLEIQDFENA